ncbi:MAG: glycerol-3-phosphate 1-O-acyltransferase PlsY [Oscillospiraceae bacterium]|nr:glycerol-3-phosphate 1-O-acyltransferase PlsY [Oscillospiraceae bacterium]
MDILKFILLAVGSYLIGSVSFSIIMSRLLGGDVRQKGSGNAGATNMARVYGILPGIITWLLDVLKTVFCIWVGTKLLGEWGLTVAGAACIIGHCYPIYYGFKGGKGVSVGCALALMIDLRVFACVMTVFFILAFTTKKVSLASVCATTSILIFGPVFGVGIARMILAIVGVVLIDYRHRENIKRLLNGTEKDFKAAKKAK